MVSIQDHGHFVRSDKDMMVPDQNSLSARITVIISMQLISQLVTMVIHEMGRFLSGQGSDTAVGHLEQKQAQIRDP